MERAKKEIPEDIFNPGKREKKRVVSLGRVFVGFTVRDERAITVSRDPQTNNYYVDVDDCIITVNASSFTIITAHKKD